MLSTNIHRWSGPAFILAGILWIGSNVMHALRPVGCVAEECDLPGRSMRTTGTLEGFLFIAAILLVVAGMVELWIRARAAGRSRSLGHLSLIVIAGGLGTLLASGLVSELFFAGDFPLMPFFVIPGVLGVIIGFVLFGVAILRARILPSWVAAALIVGALAMLVFNEQDARVLWSVPLGLAWIAVGYVLWSDTRRSPAIEA